MIVVTVFNQSTGAQFWLRGTIWTSDEARAEKFDSVEKAASQFGRAMKFTKPRVFAKQFGAPSYVNSEGTPSRLDH